MVGFDDGVIFDDMIEEWEVVLNLGDLVVFYIDGIIEVCNLVGDEFGCDWFVVVLLCNEEWLLSEVVK